jgi:hypothetical protein
LRVAEGLQQVGTRRSCCCARLRWIHADGLRVWCVQRIFTLHYELCADYGFGGIRMPVM